MTKVLRGWQVFAIAALTFPALLLLAPSARADIVEVEAATSCPGSIGGGLCNGSNPYNLNTLLSDNNEFLRATHDTDAPANHPGMNSPTIVKFTALAGQYTSANPCTFDLGFVSWQGTGTTSVVPEPGTFSLLATGLFGLIGLARRRLNS
jgi:hypothetical protein